MRSYSNAFTEIILAGPFIGPLREDEQRTFDALNAYTRWNDLAAAVTDAMIPDNITGWGNDDG